MPLIDAMRSGVDLANAAYLAKINAAKAHYAEPMTQEELYKTQTENDYLPEKLQLANKHQSLINQYYGNEHQAAIDYQNLVNKNYQKNIDSEIANKNAETQFIPLKYAIQAENAMRNNSRFGGAYQYLKAIADLPAEQRSVWLGNPENYDTYMQMINELHGSMSSKQGSSSLLTPALLKRVGLEAIAPDVVGTTPQQGVIVSPSLTGGLAAPVPAAQGQMPPPSAVMPPNGGLGASMLPPQGQMPSANVPPGAPPGNYRKVGGAREFIPPTGNEGLVSVSNPQINQAPQGGMAAPVNIPQGGMGAMPGSPAPAQPPMQPGAPQPSMPHMQPQQPALAPNTPPLTSDAANIAVKDNVSPQEANNAANDAKNGELSPAEKQKLGFQMAANKKSVGQYSTNRALGGVTLHSLLMDNQERFGRAFANAAKAAGVMGQGSIFLDKFKKEQPEAYSDYLWITQDVVPNISNNVKVMEGLSSTDNQRNALNDMLNSVLHWNSSPELAVKNINKTIYLLGAQADAALKTAQPIYPGVLERLYGLKQNKGDYFDSKGSTAKATADLSKMSTEELMKMYKEAK